MPIQDYGCRTCNHIWEVTVLDPTDVPDTCPDCLGRDIRPFISWRGMYTDEHKRAWNRPPPGNPTSVVVPSNIKKRKDK
jgi:putative FmdB family regulatory protein